MADTKISALTAASTPLAGTEVLPIVQSGTTKQVSVANLTAGRAVSASQLSSTTKVSAKIATSGTYYRVYEILAIGGTAIGEISYSDTNDTMRIANLSNYVNTSMTFYNNGSDRMEIMPNGDIKALNGNLVIGTSGKGIDFSATPDTGLSELLADYEEGTWTPTMLTTGTNFASITYDGRVAGKYVKIGQLVYVMGTMRTNSIDTTGATGTVAIGNLPFTVKAAQAGPLFDNSSPGSLANVGDYAGDMPINIKAASGTTRLDLQFRTAVNGFDDNLAIADLDTGLGKNYTSFACCYVAA
jgi:hypothetical protein